MASYPTKGRRQRSRAPRVGDPVFVKGLADENSVDHKQWPKIVAIRRECRGPRGFYRVQVALRSGRAGAPRWIHEMRDPNGFDPYWITEF